MWVPGVKGEVQHSALAAPPAFTSPFALAGCRYRPKEQKGHACSGAAEGCQLVDCSACTGADAAQCCYRCVK